LKADVEDALAAAKAAPKAVAAPVAVEKKAKAVPQKAAEPVGHYEDFENSTIRKVIAERLTFSKQNIPHYYVTISVCVDELLKIRAKLNKVASSRISVNDMVIKAASLAAVKVPETNSQWMESHTRQFKHVNMNVAVQTEHGLMVPVVRNTNLLGLEEISTQVKDVAGKARNNKLTPELLNGGTFTISNMGMFGVHQFSAIVNPPQACILAVSSAEKRVVVNEDAKEGESPFKVSNMMNVTLSSDHRVVDGAIAAQWGIEFKKYIENPQTMLL